MSKFNTTAVPSKAAPNTVNFAGGDAFAQSPEVELAALVTTSMVQDQYYRSAEDSLARLRELVGMVDPYYAAQAAVYVRNEDGLRSISHALAGEVAHSVKGVDWTKRFFDRVVRRPDDMTEILAYYMGNYGKPIPNSLKKGLAQAFGKFDEYQLAKYRGEGHTLSLVDVVNLVHPTPTDKNAEALKKLVEGTLRSRDTFEAKLSAAGSDQEAKTEAWRDLVLTGKIGHLALLRNLRNIAETGDTTLINAALALLIDENRIRKSLILPMSFVVAANQLAGYPKIVAAISKALDISLANIPDLGEDIMIVVDGSGSMGSPAAGNQGMTCKYVGSIFAAALFKKSGADVAVFGDSCGPVEGLNPADSVLTLANKIQNTSYGYSTNFPSIFVYAAENLRKAYDTVVIFSDMQAWVTDSYGFSNPQRAFESYRKTVKADPHVFAFDLTGYGSAQFPQSKVAQLSGFSDKSIALMAKLKEDPRALVTAIKAVEI